MDKEKLIEQLIGTMKKQALSEKSPEEMKAFIRRWKGCLKALYNKHLKIVKFDGDPDG